MSNKRLAAREIVRAAASGGYRKHVSEQMLEACELGDLTQAQRDGLECAFCGGHDGLLIPILDEQPCSLFIHRERGECGPPVVPSYVERINSLIADLDQERQRAPDPSQARNVSLAITHLEDALLRLCPPAVLRTNPGRPHLLPTDGGPGRDAA